MKPQNWTLVTGCATFILVGFITLVAGATFNTVALRAIVGAFLGGLVGLAIDYFAAQAPPRISSVHRRAFQPSDPLEGFAELEDEP